MSSSHDRSPAPTPMLSLILCSRNDAYMGNSLWRLQTALNYVGNRVRALGRDRDVEVIVADWGSEIPLAEVIALEPAAAGIVSFLRIPPALARDLQQDSPFPEVLALNAAARRARGQYIGRIDQDTLVGDRFLRWLLDAPPAAGTLFFANRRNIPYRLAVLCPRLPIVEQFLSWFRGWLLIETGRVFYNNSVGIWLLHRDVWNECGGYDQRLIYMNDMEIDMVGRLMTTYPLVDLGPLVEYDFYHLDHYHPRGSRSSSTHRTVNHHLSMPRRGVQPNGDGWGLAAYPLDLAGQTPDQRRGVQPPDRHRVRDVLGCAAFSVYTAVRTGMDRLAYPFIPKWRRRAAAAWSAVQGQPVIRWPSLLRRLWLERPSARRVIAR